MYKKVANSFEDFVEIFNNAKDSLISGERLLIYLNGDEFYYVGDDDDSFEPNWDLVEEAQMMARIVIDENLFATLREDPKTEKLHFDIYRL